jgi:putative acetyltransferase
MMDLLIRDEQAKDIDRITEITRAAFLATPHSSQTEHLIVENLRREQALFLSLVAVIEGDIVGHIAFSEVDISDGSTGWFGLGPLTVKPERQGKGIGSALVRAGLERLRQLGAKGCVLLGAPAFYRQFGFANDPELLLEEASQEFFLSLPLSGTKAHGVVTYHPAFFDAC